MDKFSKIDALLPMFLDKDNKWTVSIDELIKTMKENHTKLPSNINQWNKIVGVNPKFENIENLLGNHEFLQKLGGSSFEGINLAIRIDNLSMFKFYFILTGFPSMFTSCCNLHSKNIVSYLLNIHENEYLKDIPPNYYYFSLGKLLGSLLENMNDGVTKEIKDLIYNKIKDIVERNPGHINLVRTLDLSTEKKKSYDLEFFYSNLNEEDREEIYDNIRESLEDEIIWGGSDYLNGI